MLTIVERKNESVEVTNPAGEVKTYLPRFDLGKAKELLERFNKLITSDGRLLCSFWEYKGYYLYPVLQEWLFWHVCVALVHHQEAWNDLRSHEVVFEFEPKRDIPHRLKNLFEILYQRRHFGERAAYNLCAMTLRLWERSPSQVVVYDDGLTGFRYQKLKAILKDLTPYSRIERLRSLRDVWGLLQNRDHFCLGFKAWRYPPPPHVDYASAAFLHPYLSQQEFNALIDAIHRRCCDFLAEIPLHERALAQSHTRLCIGYDQIEEAAAFVVACKLRQIPVVTYQHGLFTKYHAGWVAPGIPKEYCNVAADTLVVWGQHWKDVLLKHSNIYGEAEIEVGAHLRNTIDHSAWPCGKMPSQKPLTILLPFEFLTDNLAVSAYIRRFLSLGWHVWVKIRPLQGKAFSDDRFAFDEDIRDGIRFVENLGAEDLDHVDVVACTQSSVGYEMMAHRKPIWYLETPFRFVDLVETGIAHPVSHSTLDEVAREDNLAPLLIPRYSLDQYKILFSDQKLQDVLQQLIGERIAR